MATILVTGGAGFIGSNIVAGLVSHMPQHRIVVCDQFHDGDKWRNTCTYTPDEIISSADLFYWLQNNEQELETIIHMGALASTTERNADVLLEVNVKLPKILRAYCIANNKRFIYASSGATYGDGTNGFNDDISLDYMQSLRPLNANAWSKHMFDMLIAKSLARGEPQPPQWVGLKFFNIFGPNEYHKLDQQSVLLRIFPHAEAGRPVHLFKSYNHDYKDGGQLRDFMYVKDVTRIVLWLLQNPEVSGLFNIGTGQPRSFEDLARGLFQTLGKEPRIHYDDMPEELRNNYQYYTCANMVRLRAAGYVEPFYTLEEGIADFVQHYLLRTHPYT